MLILGRKLNESIIVNDNIEIKIVEIKGDYVKLGISAPRTIPVHRKEVYLTIQQENNASLDAHPGIVENIQKLLPKKPSK
jgi:carbon storage regulator